VASLLSRHLDRRARGERLSGVSSKPEDIVAYRLDLLLLVAAQDVVGTARIERRHLGSRLHRLRVLQPDRNPFRIEAAMREGKIGGPSRRRTFRLLVALLMAAKAVEVILRHQL